MSSLSTHTSVSVQSLIRVRLFVTPWIPACQASLSITNSRSLPKLMCIKLVMPSSHLILCHPLLLLPPIPPSIRVFSSESAPHMRWPKYWSFSLSINPSSEHPGLVSCRILVGSPCSPRDLLILSESAKLNLVVICLKNILKGVTAWTVLSQSTW